MIEAQTFGVKLGRVLPKNDAHCAVRLSFKDNQPPEWGEVAQQSHRFNDRFYLLDQLEKYDRLWRYMKRSDRDAFRLFQSVGCRMLAQSSLLSTASTLRYWEGDLPAFGMFAMVPDDYSDDDRIYPKIWYFHRHKVAPSGIQPSSGAIYSVGLFIQEDGLKECEKGVVGGFFVAIQPDGSVRILKQLDTGVQYNNRNSFKWVPRKRYVYPWTAAMFAETWMERDGYPDIDAAWSPMINLMFAAVLQPTGGVQVRASKGSSTALIALTDNDAKLVFPARERETKGRRIWHYNRGWTDRLGRVVPGHFKGLRDFDWKGWKIHIRHDANAAKTPELMPGLASDVDAPRDRAVGPGEAGKRIKTFAESKATKNINKAIRDE